MPKGVYGKTAQHLVHGHAARRSATAEYVAWKNMIRRCTNQNDPQWEDYGGRGISVCARWNSFEHFLADMGLKPSPELSIDRKNNDGNYEPDNCRWATRIEQNNNQRRNRRLT